VKRSFSEQAAVDAIHDRNLTSVSAVLKRLGKSPQGGGSHKLIRRIAAQHHLSTTHWLGQGWAKGRNRPEYQKSVLESLKTLGRHTRSDITRRLVRDGIKKWQCEKCHRKTWNGKPIPLERHHVDGNRSNNSVENIKLLCPNCHAQTPNFSGKNKSSFRHRI